MPIVTPPRISGAALRALVAFAKTPPGALAVRRIFRKDLRIDQLDRLPEEVRGPIPLDTKVVAGRPPRRAEDAGLPRFRGDGWPRSAESIADAYAKGASPMRVVANAIAAAKQLGGMSPSRGPILDFDPRATHDAEEAAERWKRGKAKSRIDGVPVIVKEQYRVEGLPARLGTIAIPDGRCAEDATVVKALRDAGAIVLGTSPMTEYGMSPLGVNPHRTMPRNAHRADRVAGGSSTGSGVGVALGVAPFAVAADGGGSIRIPACVNGVFGIKPTFGRVSRFGDGFAGSVNHPGPIGATVFDLAAFLEATSARDEKDRLTDEAPDVAPGSLVRALGRGCRGLRIGVLDGEIDAASPATARAVREALRALEKEGATLVPLALDLVTFASPIGYVIIASEAFAETRDVRLTRPEMLGLDLRLSFAAVSGFTAGELVDAMRLRAGLRLATAAAMRDVDLLALPTTVTGAAAVRDDEMRGGFVDSRALDAMCRFTFFANLTGLPACTCPVGDDESGMPIGLQLVGDAWDEATVLAAAAHLERIGVARAKRPELAVDLLEGA